MTKNEIFTAVTKMKAANEAAARSLMAEAKVTDYKKLVRHCEYNGATVDIWTEAIQTAINENEVVIIPPSDKPYLIDSSIIVPSHRRIEAEGATVRLLEGCTLLMLRNRSVANGTHAPIIGKAKDLNITVHGGTWDESIPGKAGYGKSGMLDDSRSFFGVSACFYFGNMEGLTLKDVTFVNTGGFSVQIGNVKDAVFENIEFINVGADGLHINGNCEHVSAYDIRGQVGDDLVALNMYDWLNSSVNFGPTKCVWCEKLNLYENSPYKALRILPGTYCYDDCTEVDCSLTDAVIKNVKGISTFKMYFQTHSYRYDTEVPEKGGVGSADNVYFEDITVDLDAPIDQFEVYNNSHPITGTIAAFELGSRIGSLYFKNIDLKLHRDRYPESYLLCIGPKSVRENGHEYFNPNISGTIDYLELSDIRINGECVTDISPYIKKIVFDNIYGDGKSSGSGIIGETVLKIHKTQ